MNCLVCSSVDVYQEDLQDPFPLVEKLKNCIPEIKWGSTDQFCVTCVLEINKFHAFKTECINAYFHHRRKSPELLEDQPGGLQPKHSNVYNLFRSSSPPVEYLPPPPDGVFDDSSDHFPEDSHYVEDLKYHQESHLLPNCFLCPERFSDKELLEAHLESEHAKSEPDEHVKSEPEAVQPEIAGTAPSNSLATVNNSTDKKNEDGEQTPIEKGRKPVRKYSCEICGEYFKFARNVIDHAIEVHKMDDKMIKPYSCEVCEMRFSCCANLLQHKKYHDKTRSLICAFCGKSFITKSDLTVHEHTHYNRRNYKCEKCDKAFNTNKTLRSHNLVCHTNPELWKYVCAMCGRRFPLKSGHDQHVKRHLGDKKHRCHICEKSFVSASELKKHVTFHSNVRLFKCTICEKEYKEKKLYHIHLTKVHNIGNAKVPVRVKKFTCHVCGNMFADRQKLDRHMCTHTGMKPFPCDLCIKRFTDKSYLKNHKKVVHGCC